MRQLSEPSSCHGRSAPGLVVGEEVLGDFAVVWAANGRAPVSVARSQDGITVLWGDAFAGRQRLAAQAIGDAWLPVVNGHATPDVRWLSCRGRL